MAAYLHCDGCRRAFDVAQVPSCPHCGQRLGGEPEPATLEERVADAAARIASALARATVEERAALEVALGRRRLAAELAAEGSPSPVARWLPASLAAVQRAVIAADGPRRLTAGAPAGRVARLVAVVGVVARPWIERLSHASRKLGSPGRAPGHGSCT